MERNDCGAMIILLLQFGRQGSAEPCRRLTVWQPQRSHGAGWARRAAEAIAVRLPIALVAIPTSRANAAIIGKQS
jgi:hypothetical protein